MSNDIRIIPVNDGSLSPENYFWQLLQLEVLFARTKHPGNELLVTALLEEAGELARACLEGSAEDIHREAVQVAAVALRIATEGDQSVKDWREKIGKL